MLLEYQWKSGLTCVLGGCPTQSSKQKIGVGFALSPVANQCWQAANCEVHRWSSGRVISIRLIVKDPDKNPTLLQRLRASCESRVGSEFAATAVGCLLDVPDCRNYQVPRRGPIHLPGKRGD